MVAVRRSVGDVTYSPCTAHVKTLSSTCKVVAAAVAAQCRSRCVVVVVVVVVSGELGGRFELFKTLQPLCCVLKCRFGSLL